MSDINLKPCPFCGGDKAYIRRSPGDDGFGDFFSVKCNQCKAETAQKYVSNGNCCPIFYSEVRDMWNIRAPDQLLKDIFKDITKDNRLSPDTFDRLIKEVKK